VQLHGKQRLLAIGPLCQKCAEREKEGAMPTCTECKKIRHKADLAFAEVLHADDLDKATDNNELIAILDRYLVLTKSGPHKRKESGWKMANFVFQKFIAAGYGDIRVKDLKPLHVNEFLAKMAEERVHTGKYGGGRLVKWGRSTQNLFITSLQTALNWAKEEGLISRNPIAGMRRPKTNGGGRRTEEVLVPPEDHAAMMAYSPPAWQDLLTALAETGARPSEVINVTATDFHEDRGTWEFVNKDPDAGFTHKTAHKDKDRTVYLTGPMVEMCKRLAAEHPTGPLFRDPKGRPHTLRHVIGRFTTMRKFLDINPKITAYSYRHSFATDYLLHGDNGKPGSIALCAELLGNTVRMVERHYGHLCKNHVALRNALLNFKRGSAGTGNPA
jgi:integrase